MAVNCSFTLNHINMCIQIYNDNKLRSEFIKNFYKADCAQHFAGDNFSH